jgi:hypothetical protein
MRPAQKSRRAFSGPRLSRAAAVENCVEAECAHSVYLPKGCPPEELKRNNTHNVRFAKGPRSV